MMMFLPARLIRVFRTDVSTTAPTAALQARLRRAGYADLERQPRQAHHWANR